MHQIYEGYGIRFQYPDEWQLEELPQDTGVTINVENGRTSFWSLTLFFDCPDPSEVLEAAVSVFREEYDELDSHPANVRICNCPTIARDLEFVCLELINSAFLRAFGTDDFTALVLYQDTDDELEQLRPVLEAMSQSLTCLNDDATEFEPDEPLD